MRIRRRTLRARATAVTALAGVLALLWPAGAGAAPARPGLVLSGVHTEEGQLVAQVTAVHVTPGSTLDTSTLSVRVGDDTMPARVRPAASVSGAPTRVFDVVLDGARPQDTGYLAAARAAANAVAAALPPDVALGLVVVGDRGITEPLTPSPDRAAFTAAVAAAESGEEDVVEAVDAAARTLGGVSAAVDRHILVISNGANVVAGERHSRVGASVATGEIGLDVLAVGASGTGLTGLRLMAEAAGGRLLAAGDEAAMVAMAEDSARLLGQTLTVTADLPDSLSGQTAVVTVEAPGFTPGSATVAFGTWDAGLPAASSTFAWVPDWLVYVVALLMFAAVACAVLALAWPRSQSQALIKKIGHFGPRRTLPRPKPATTGPETVGTRLVRSVLSASASVVRAGRLEERIAARLERADMKLRAHEWLALRTGVAVGAGLLFALIGGLLGFVFGLALGVLVTMVYQMQRISRRERLFTEQLPDGLQLVIGSLRSGFSLSQALESLVRESPEPLASEFGRAVAEHRLGADLSDALDRLAERVGSNDLNWAVMAVRIQRDVGGNLADVLQTSVDTMRERERLRRQVRTLSSEGRLSAWILVCVPVFLSLFMAIYRRSYLMPLVTDPRGIVMLVVGLLLFVVGVVWMTRVVKVET